MSYHTSTRIFSWYFLLVPHFASTLALLLLFLLLLRPYPELHRNPPPSALPLPPSPLPLSFKLIMAFVGLAAFAGVMCTVWMSLVMKYPENYITCGYYTYVTVTPPP